MDIKNVTVSAFSLNGSITPPPSKSEVIRVLILAALCGVRPNEVLVPHRAYCGDIISACEAVTSAFFDKSEKRKNCASAIPVGESATLLRLLAPVLLARSGYALFDTAPSLFGRDMSELADSIGCKIRLFDGRFIEFAGELPRGVISVSAERTSQFASGLLIACALAPDTALRISSPVSAPYIRLTMDRLESFGCPIVREQGGIYRAAGNGLCAPKEYVFGCDYSYIANFAAANKIMDGGGHIDFEGIDPRASAPDSAIFDMLARREVDVSSAPDLFPILCVAALKREGETHISGAARLRGKESDRVRSTHALVTALGGSMTVCDDGVTVCGGRNLHGAEIDSFGDHRIVMAAAIAALMCGEPITILGADAVNKSAPQFFDDYARLGGIVDEYIRK